MLSPLVLDHFDPSKTLIVAANASFTGIGKILLQHVDNGRKYIVYHISAQNRNDTQRNYSQLEKEPFALISTVECFHKFLWDRLFYRP